MSLTDGSRMCRGWDLDPQSAVDIANYRFSADSSFFLFFYHGKMNVLFLKLIREKSLKEKATVDSCSQRCTSYFYWLLKINV